MTTHTNIAADLAQATVAATLERLIGWANQHPDLRCHVLIDPAMRDIQETWELVVPGIGEHRTPIALHESLFPEDQRPCFYALDLTKATEHALLESSIGTALEDWHPDAAMLGEGHRICGWLWLPQDISADDLAQHLARQAVQYDLSRNGRILLRYFDPRVLDLLWQTFAPQQRVALFGPIRAWHFIERTGTLKTLTAPQDANAAAPERLILNEGQWTMISRVGLVNQTLALVQAARALPLHQTAANEADHALIRAQINGLQDEQDLIKFAFLAVTVHPRFDEHSHIRSILQAVSEGAEFCAEVQRLTPHQWQQISAGRPPQ